MSTLTTIEFDHFDLDVRWHREGRFYPASGTGPAECPVPKVDSVVLRFGQFTSFVLFAQLPEAAQAYVLDELEAEITEYREPELDPDFAELL